ncbi:MAG TPA: HAD-IA family hydrolase [Thermoanaerobaculia bacterium]|nr:HAD-IA family hydrolase [Thermoanaerobaculia bacterium]
MNARPYRLLIFDWDGTIMDSIASIVACSAAAIRDLGLGGMPEAAIRGTIGLGMREMVDALFPGCEEDLYGRLLERYRAHWLSTYRDLSVPFPGVDRTLRALAAEGYLLAIATGKSRRGLDLDLSRTGLGALFAATRTADEAFSKPNPQMLLDVLEELGQRRRTAVMIGDSTHDLQMAASAGIAAVAVCTGSHPRGELLSLAPLACLGGVVELPEWLARRED